MTDATIENINPPKRRWLHLSVRGLMVLVLILAVGLGWVVHRARVQLDAVAAIERTGGKVYYDWQWSADPALRSDPESKKPNGPRWLVEWLGVDYFGHVAFVQLGKTATDAEMAHVGRLPRLVYFAARNASAVTDAGAEYLSGLRELQTVVLSGTKVTGAALVNLRGKTNLTSLILTDLPVTDLDLANIDGLKKLEMLDLSSTKVTDAGLAHVDGMVNLRELRLNSTAVTGTGFRHLKGMNALLWLRLSKSQVSDLSSIPPLPALMGIILDETPVDDAGLAGLPDHFPKLKSLYLVKTGVTDAGLPQVLKFSKSLNAIGLSGPKITDAAAPTIAKLENLMNLQLNDTGITDATLDQLAGLKALRNVGFERTATTAAGFAQLKKALPQVKSTIEIQAALRATMQAQARPASKAQTKKPGPQP